MVATTNWFRIAKWLSLLILAVGLGVTWLSWSTSVRLTASLREKDFDHRIDLALDSIQARLRTHEQILLGVVGLFAADRTIRRFDFRTYVATLRLDEHYPGIQGVGFASALTGEVKADHIAEVRREGFPGYDVTPAGDRPLYAPIIYLEPFSGRNLRAFGYDMFSEPTRNAAMSRARDSGHSAMSGKVTLVQETEIAPQAGVLIYEPVYRPEKPRETVEQKRLALLGWAYSPLRMEDMMQSLMGGLLADLKGRIRLAIYDGESVAPDALMFDSEGAQPRPANPALVGLRRLEFGGQAWTVELLSLPAFEQREDGSNEPLIVLGGGSLSVALALLVWVMARNRERLTSTLEQANEANRKLIESRSLLQRIYDTSGVAIFLVDRGGLITHANRSMAEMFNRPLEDLIGSEYVGLVQPDERPIAHKAMLTLMEGRISSVDVERRYWRSDGSGFWGNLRGQSVFDSYGMPTGLVGVIANIDDRKRLQTELEWQARTDVLTGINNRRHFMTLAEAELARTQRYGGALSLLMMDVDEFKVINDTHGHAVGDEVLRHLTELCRKTLREIDVIGRVGGEEFAMLLPETDFSQACEAAERLRFAAAAAKVTLPHGLPLRFTVSVGVTSLAGRADNLDALLSEADAALYAAKRAGRNRVCTAGPA